MEEKYELTKEQKKIIKNFIHVGNIAKRSVQRCNNGDDLIERMKKKKDESGKDINIRDTLEAHLKQCNQVLYERPPGDEWSYLDLIIESPATKETKYGRALEKLKPYMKEYVNMLKEAIETHELYKKQKDELEETGTITSAHWTVDPEKIKKEKEELHKEEKIKASRDWQAKFMSELEEMKREHEKTKKGEKEDKENIGQYVESVKKEETDQELPVAEGLKNHEEHTAKKETPIKKTSPYNIFNPFQPIYPKYTESTFLTSLEWGLRSKGILKSKDKGLV